MIEGVLKQEKSILCELKEEEKKSFEQKQIYRL